MPEKLRFDTSQPRPKWKIIEQDPNLPDDVLHLLNQIKQGALVPEKMRNLNRSIWVPTQKEEGYKFKGMWFRRGNQIYPPSAQDFQRDSDFFWIQGGRIIHKKEARRQPFGGMSLQAAKDEFDILKKLSAPESGVLTGTPLALLRGSIRGRALGATLTRFPIKEDHRLIDFIFAYLDGTKPPETHEIDDLEDFIIDALFKAGQSLSRVHAEGFHSAQSNPSNISYNSNGEIVEMDIESLRRTPKEISPENRNFLYAMDITRALNYICKFQLDPDFITSYLAGYMNRIGERRSVINKIDAEKILRRTRYVIEHVPHEFMMRYMHMMPNDKYRQVQTEIIMARIIFEILLLELCKIGGNFKIPRNSTQVFMDAHENKTSTGFEKEVLASMPR